MKIKKESNYTADVHELAAQVLLLEIVLELLRIGLLPT